MLGPDPNTVSTTEKHSCLCSPKNNLFCSESGTSTEPGKTRDPMRTFAKVLSNYFLHKCCYIENLREQREKSQ